jgi:hypothetical protein
MYPASMECERRNVSGLAALLHESLFVKIWTDPAPVDDPAL